MYSSRRDQLDQGAEYAKEYHPPAVPPASPEHETIRIKPVELSRTIDPRRAPTQKLVVRRGAKPGPGAVPEEESRVRLWPIAFGVAALALAVALLWYRHANTSTAAVLATEAPAPPTRARQGQVEVAPPVPLPQPAPGGGEPVSTKAASPQGIGPNSVAPKVIHESTRLAPLPRSASERAPASVGSAKAKVAPSTPTAHEPSAPRDLWLQ